MNTDHANHSLQNAEKFLREGKAAQAAAASRQALIEDPLSHTACLLLGESLRQSGEVREAIKAYERGLSMQPRHAALNSALGHVLSKLDRHEEALAAFRRALEADEKFAPAHEGVIHSLSELGHTTQAVEAAVRAASLWPDSHLFQRELGMAWASTVKMEEAAAAFSRAVELFPADFLSHNNLAHALESLGELEKAIAAYDRAVELAPQLAGIASNRLFAMQCAPGIPPATLRTELESWNTRFAQPLPKLPHGNDRSPDRPLKIGFISADFCSHVVGRSLLPIFQHHDPARYQIYAYSDTQRLDDFTKQLSNYTDGWRNICRLPDQRVAEMIHWDKIDILIDLAQHSAGNRLQVLARKPAPVQATYLGYPGSTGLTAIDYRISDPYLDPPGADLTTCTEETIRLPHSYWCYQPAGAAPDIAAAPSHANGFITFGCLANFSKVGPNVLAAWAKILEKMPSAKLILYCQSDGRREKVRQILPAGRVEFVAWQPWDKYMETYQRIDVALDPFPRGGGITTCDALWMGVPVITLAGDRAMFRGGCSVLANAGLPELVAASENEYIELALQAARWVELRPGLRQGMQATPLMDGPRIARDLEAAYRWMWEKWTGSSCE